MLTHALRFLTLFLAITVFSTAAIAVENPSVKKIEKELSSLEKRISKVNGELKKIQHRNVQLTHEMQNLEKQEKQIRHALREHLHAFNDTARTIARVERMPVEAMVFSGGLRDGHKRQWMMEKGRETLDQKIDNDRQKIRALQKVQEDRKKALSEVLELEKKEDRRKKHLEKLFKHQVKMLALNSQEKADLVAETHAMKQAKALQELLAMRKTSTHKISRISSPYKGHLPVQGKVIRRYNEKNELGIKNRGLTIEALAGSSVTAVRDGRIIYNGPFREYGHIIILEHDQNLHSLYSGSRASKLEIGDYIRAGKVISTMPAEEAPKLYLEIRQNGEAINPKRWLSAKG